MNSKTGPDMARVIKAIEDVWRGKTPFQMRLKGQIWQARTHFDPPSEDPLVVFAIPLVARARSEDWDVVERNLIRTLASFRAQTHDRWRVFICGQDAPEGITFDDQVQFLRYRGRDKFFDKGDKRVQLVRHAADVLTEDGYYFQFDADDILHPGVVEHICRDNNGSGYYIDTGYMADLERRMFAPLGTQKGQSAFRAFCGSSSATRFDFRGSKAFLSVLRNMRSHTRIEERMRDYGFAMQPVPFPAALYLVNHGENMIQRRGNLDKKMGYLERKLITETDEIARIEAEFGLAALAQV